MVAKQAYCFRQGTFFSHPSLPPVRKHADTSMLLLFVSLGLIVTGGSDRLINVWDPEDSSSPVYTLAGHSDNVCSLFADTDGHIVSGSWDKYATTSVLVVSRSIAWSISSGGVG